MLQNQILLDQLKQIAEFTKIVVVTSKNVEIFSQNYAYDANGLMTGTDHTDYVRKRGRVTRSYAYDLRNEIASITVAYTSPNWTGAAVNRSYDYVYDANGNPLKYETPKLKDVSQNNMVIDTASDRLLERKNPAKNESEKYTYDAVGNMIRREVVNATTGTKNRQIHYEEFTGEVVGRHHFYDPGY